MFSTGTFPVGTGPAAAAVRARVGADGPAYDYRPRRKREMVPRDRAPTVDPRGKPVPQEEPTRPKARKKPRKRPEEPLDLVAFKPMPDLPRVRRNVAGAPPRRPEAKRASEPVAVAKPNDDEEAILALIL